MRVLARIRKQLGVALPPMVFINRPTVEHLAEEIRRIHPPLASGLPELADERGPDYRYLVPFGPDKQGRRLVCVHGAGGNVMNFSALSEGLGKNSSLLGFQARGVNGKDQPFARIEDMAAAYLQELRSVQPQGPYFLAGYCGGGIVAYEMASILRREGQDVPLLVLIDCYRPGLVVQGQSRLQRWSQGVRKGGLDYLVKRGKAWLQRHASAAKAYATIAFYKLQSSTIPYELRDFWLTHAFTRSARHFEPAHYPGELTLMRAIDLDPELANVGRDLGWTGMASEIRTFDVPGNHLTLLDQPNVEVLAARMSECLDRAVATAKR
jgi:thioesterase domain-containing protein